MTFLWPAPTPPQDLLAAARRDSFAVLGDCRGSVPTEVLSAVGSHGDLLVVLDQVTPDLEAGLAASASGRVWVECPPTFATGDRKACAARLVELAGALPLVVVTGDLGLLRELATTDSPPLTLALKGSEAAGFGSLESTSMLLSIAVSWTRERPGTALVAWGGVATPEAAAAFLETGAAGVVVESAHWLTAAVPLPPDVRELLATARHGWARQVGRALGLSCRVFDKGNSALVRRLDAELARLTAPDAPAEADGSAARHLSGLLRSPAAGLADPSCLTPWSTEAAFATGFVERFGASTPAALAAFSARVEHQRTLAGSAMPRLLAATDRSFLGSRLPLVQGAMTWITDSLKLARSIAEAGALPTLALGVKDRVTLDVELGSVREQLATFAWAVNLVALPENPVREEQLAWIESIRPPWVTLAAGEPRLVGRLLTRGIKVLFLAADDAMIRAALHAGARHLIIEGNEGGGHVGEHTTATLAQIWLELARREPDLCRGARVVLAGGVFDHSTALRAVLLGADALQLGTAYLATSELVASGALTPLYQQMVLEARPGDTVVTGESVGLRLRALRSPCTRAIAGLEAEMATSELAEAARRARLEALTTGSLLLAARGVRQPGGAEQPEARCREEGQFLAGAVAGLLDRPSSLLELHESLFASASAADVPPAPASRVAPARVTSRPRETTAGIEPHERIAITGMAVVNALGSHPDAVWEASASGALGITEVPARRWDHSLIFDRQPRTPGKTYSRAGAFCDLTVDRKELGIPPQDFRTMAASTRLTLWLARRALESSGLLASPPPAERVGVLISQNSGEAASTLPDMIFSTSAPWLARAVAQAVPLAPEQVAAVEEHVRATHIPVDDTTLLGRLNCAAAGFICNTYGFRGPSWSVSAACATGLVALYSAVLLMRSGVIDAALVGGGEEPLTPAHFLEFAAVGALAGLSGVARPAAVSCRPFDLHRDGMVLGEGGAMLVLERESTARARGARILALIAGVGASNNDRGMVESVAETQEIAIGASLADAGYGGGEIDLVECHATGTSQGDVEEVAALKRFVPRGRRTVLASFKSQIGHTLGAAGLQSLIRGVAAMRHATFPPTPCYDHPDPRVDLETWGFEVLPGPAPWPATSDRPRRFQVDAFGFGGPNYVVQVEEEGTGGRPPARRPVKAAFLPTPEPSLPPLALVFAGQGTQIVGMGQELCAAFPEIRVEMARIASALDYDLLGRMAAAGEAELKDTRLQQPALYVLELAIARHLVALGARPAALAGHSLGELVALALAGVLSPEDGVRLVDARARCMADAAGRGGDPGTMIATDAPQPVVRQLLARHPEVVVTNWNSPVQTVLGGPRAPVEVASAELASAGFRAHRLNVSMAFHSPMAAALRPELEAFAATITFSPPRLPVICNTTAEPFPDDADEIRALVMRQLESPVRWVESLEYLRRAGVTAFVEVGPRDVLCGMVSDTLEGASCLPTCLPGDEARAFRRALVELGLRAGQVQGSPPGAPSSPAPDESQAVSAELAPYLDAIVRIIMETTGYERNEIGPEMDLRQQLAIRSSRLPLIIDAAERQFGITVRLEDFLTVRTVRDLATRVAEVVARDGGHLPSEAHLSAQRTTAAPQATIPGLDVALPSLPTTSGPVHRLVFTERPLGSPGAPSLPALPEHATVVVLALDPAGPLAAAAAGLVTAGLGTRVTVVPIQGDGARDPVARGLDGPDALTEHLDATPSLAGLIVVLDGAAPRQWQAPGGIAEALSKLFAALQTLLRAEARALCLLLTREGAADGAAAAVAEGFVGMLLAAALEYRSVVFRHLAVTDDAALGDALMLAASTTVAPLQLVADGATTAEVLLAHQPLMPDRAGEPALRLGDVVLVSGGARGITPHLAAALAPLEVKLVLLGRSPTAVDGSLPEVVQRLRGLGLEAAYHQCDVTDADQVAALVADVVARHGRIDAVLHGAGVIEDSFIAFMTPASVARVTATKVTGLQNLLRAATPHGLRSVTALSSLAAAQGNVGQASYCAANRAMAAVLRAWAAADHERVARVVWLPPVAGAGMADGAEVRELLRLRGLERGYISLAEMAVAARQELLLGSRERSSVGLLREAPTIPTVTLDLSDHGPSGMLRAPLDITIRPADAPLVDQIQVQHSGHDELLAIRTFSPGRDLWLRDHRPYQDLPPLVSAVMAIEAMVESAAALVPELEVLEVRAVDLLRPLYCQEPCQVLLRCRRLAERADGVLVKATVERPAARRGAGEVEPSTWYFASEVLLGPGRPAPSPGFRVSPADLDTRPMSGTEARARYQSTSGLQGRYTVLDSLDGSGPGVIRAHMVFRESEDVTGWSPTRYRLPVYALEGMLQVTSFYLGMREIGAGSLTIPAGIGRARPGNRPAPGEPLTIEARMTAQSPEEHVWEGHVLDARERVVIAVQEARLRWFAP